MNKKLNHKNLCIDEISSFVKKKKNQICFIVKKMILICQNVRFALRDVKKRGGGVVCVDKNSDLFC